MGIEAFHEFYSPDQSLQSVCGRVVNLSTEDSKLKEQSIGLFNVNYGIQCRLRLNLAQIKQYALFEGEVVVAQGFMDTKKLNVNRIWKPAISAVNADNFSLKELEASQSNYCGKALQVMVACGPFTVNNELSYAALKDLMAVVQRDQPHALILAGPFINQNHEDIQNGDLKYYNAEAEDHDFLDYDQLFDELMSYIYKSLGELTHKTQVVIVPSANDITHMYPLPQPPFDHKSFNYRKLGASPHLVGNPGIFMLNDISIGFMNTDVVKDMCLNVCTKFEVPESQKTDEALASVGGIQRPSDAPAKVKAPPKIDQVLYGLLQQRSLYPLYPPGQSTPVEFEQVQQFMF